MAAPDYNTDLLIVADCSTATGWTELTGYTLGGTPEVDTDYYIYGTTNCISQECRKTGIMSMVYDNGTPIVLPTNGVFMIWWKYLAPTQLKTYILNGVRIITGSAVGAFNEWTVLGSDLYPYGGWKNLALDPASSLPNITVGAPTGDHTIIGITIDTLLISKGNPHGVDVLRYGRAISEYTLGEAATPATFLGFSLFNDLVTERLGLLQDVGGSYLFKGLASFGTAALPVYMRSSNVVISIDDVLRVSSVFNRFEVHHVDSDIEWISVNITALGIVSRGDFEMVDNASLLKTTCVFTSMGTFIYLSNATLSGGTYRSCDIVTQNGALMTGLTFDAARGVKALLADDVSRVTDSNFISSGTGYAIEGFSVEGDYSLNGITYSGYAGVNGTTGNECLHILATTGIVNISYPNGDAPTYHTDGATVNLIAESFDFTFTVSPAITGYEWRIYQVTALGSLAGSVELAGEESAISSSQTYNYAFGGDIFIGVQIISQPDHDYEEKTEYYTLSNSNQSVNINLDTDNNN